jgi:hypothetical protein
MRFRIYQSSLGSKLSRVKVLILQRLWDEGDDFPRGWVSSSELLALTKQKYFDRRVRELRDEAGCDIETTRRGGEHVYRLHSEAVTVPNPRGYLSTPQKQSLFEANNFRCAVCSSVFAPGIRGLQADHRVPLMRGGKHAIENWQPLCVGCNVAKRRACTGCQLDCAQCPWAFPERVGRRVQLTLAEDLDQVIQGLSQQTSRPIPEVLLDLIRAGLTTPDWSKAP